MCEGGKTRVYTATKYIYIIFRGEIEDFYASISFYKKQLSLLQKLNFIFVELKTKTFFSNAMYNAFYTIIYLMHGKI